MNNFGGLGEGSLRLRASERMKAARIRPREPRVMTAIRVGQNGMDTNKGGGPRPWTEGPTKQFPGLKRGFRALGNYADFDKEERQKQVETLLDFFEAHHGTKWVYSDGWQEAVATRKVVGSESIDPSSFRGVKLNEPDSRDDGSYPRAGGLNLKLPPRTFLEALELPRADISGVPSAV
mmetsp:Transcript_65738/g.148335  ORF Transcript_65738/g.148335 Transcript_65738/m.148335 type:complete len:178 (-) Transcript_65738:20-553(-)